VQVASWWPPPGGEESARLGEIDGGSDGFGGRGVSAAHTGSFAPSAGEDGAYSARARVASIWENRTNPSTGETTGTLSHLVLEKQT
jgi:hypothetical protein